MPTSDLGLFRAVLDQLNESVAVYGLDGKLLYANPTTERMFGRPLAQMVGCTLLELFPEAAGNGFIGALERVMQEGGSELFDFYHAPWDRWFENRLERVGGAVHVVARDITVEKRQRRRLELLASISTTLGEPERGLAGTLARLAALAGQAIQADCEVRLLSDDGAWLERAAHWSPDPAALAAAPVVSRIPVAEGLTGEVLRSRQTILVERYDLEARMAQLSSPELRGALRAYAPGSLLLVPLMAGEQVLGVLLFARRSGAAALNADDRALAMEVAPTIGLYVAHARREAEALLLRQRVELLGNSIPALIAYVSRDLRYEFVNTAYEQWLGRPRREIEGRAVEEVLPRELYLTVLPNAARALAGERVRYRTQVDLPGVGQRAVDVQYAPACAADGGVLGFSVLVLDTTAEAQLAAADLCRREEERRAAERLTRLLDVAARLAGAADAGEVAQIVIDEGFQALDATIAAMWLLDPEASALILTHQRGFPARYGETFARVSMDEHSPMGECVRSGETLWFDSRTQYAQHHPQYEQEHRPLDARPIAFGVIPISVEGRCAGCLAFGFHNERQLAPDERTLLEALTFHAGEALRRARLIAELRDVSETREAIIHASPAAIMLLDDQGIVQAWNRAAERIFGWSAAEVVGKHLPVIPAESRPQFAANLAHVVSGQEVRRRETQRLRKSGELVDVEVYGAPVRLSDGRTLSLGMVFDITERKRVERARQLIAEAGAVLARSLNWEQTLKGVVALPVQSFVDWCCVDVLAEDGSLSRIAMSGDDRGANELMPRNIPHDPSLGGASLAIATGQAQVARDLDDDYRRSIARHEAHLAALRALAARSFMSLPLKAGERIVGAISFASRTRNLDELDLALGSELANHAATALDNARLYREAERAQREAEAANRAKDQFLAMLGHELRNPLAPITTALHLMRLRAPGGLERERAVIERQVEHLSRLVDDLLDISRITRGMIELRRERVSIAHVVSRAIEMATPLFEQRQHRLTTQLEPELAVEGDPTRLSQVLSNLLANAAKYTEAGGHVEVEACRRGEHVEVSVRDNGVGLPADMLSSIFEMFVQAPQSSARTDGGLGLGLAIVKSLVQLHGGSVRAESAGLGRGSRIVVTLPAAAALVVAAPLSPPATQRAPDARRVLVVDDNRDAVELVAELLGDYGHAVRTAFDGPSALRVALEFRPEVAVLDIGLPVMDGYELAARLREEPALSGLRLIAVTGYGQLGDRKRALAAGFDHHVTKPVSVDELLRLVQDAEQREAG